MHYYMRILKNPKESLGLIALLGRPIEALGTLGTHLGTHRHPWVHPWHQGTTVHGCRLELPAQLAALGML